MRNSGKWIAVVLIVLGLVGTVSAQKGRPTPPPPTPTWSMQMLGPDVFGPLDGFTASDTVLLDVKVWGVPDRAKMIQPCNNCTVFRIEVKSPWSPVTGGPFIEFKGVELATEYNYNNVTPNCSFPLFDASGVIQPANLSPVEVGCAPAFLSHRHPQAPYNRVMFEVKAAGDALAMPVGTDLKSRGLVDTQVTGPDCYTTPSVDLIYFISVNNPDAPWPPPAAEEHVNVHRDSATQWTIDVFRTTGVIDETFTAPDPKFGRCGRAAAFWSYTKPLSTTMTWTLK